ncbi:MAG: hypothetical protein A2293_09645 [Elusimicrobia bacterium RIFOXYB2_FULL_49_7]|nr:MAG: hypothetical protein A2293_09645 [Elusimicrobia bacterium RIFOXYB2_FULL_49_7]
MQIGIVGIPQSGKTTIFNALTGSSAATGLGVDYIDLCGMGSVSGDGMDAEFFALLRSVDAILMVARSFDDPNVAHPADSINPLRDIENLTNELLLADMMVIEKRLEGKEYTVQDGDILNIRFAL